MKVLIADDERPARSELKFLISSYGEEVEFIEASSGEEALCEMIDQQIDLAFIDINLGDLSGVTVAEMIKKTWPDAEVVFATAYNNYAEKAFAIEALYYILKPFDRERVFQALDKYKKHRGQPQVVEKISKLPISYDKKMMLIDVEEIVFIETEARHCVVHTTDKSYICGGTISYYEEKLKGHQFFRVQKSYLIHLKYVTELYGWFQNTTCVKLKGFEDKIITVSRSKVKELKQQFFIT